MNYKKLLDTIIDQVSLGYVGKKDVVEEIVLAVSCGLHVLVDDISGLGKTTLLKCLGKALGLKEGRIQFTPDLLPGDITGMTIWDSNKREFILKKGPIFNEYILADEINRASSRTQSALLEAMEEKTVSIDGTSYNLPEFFSVVATKNPNGFIGTFDLPESQIDRFGIVIHPGYPTIEKEVDILRDFKERDSIEFVDAVSNSTELIELQKHISSIYISDEVLNYLVTIGNRSRYNNSIKTGLSTRGLKHILKLSQSKALYSSREFVIPEDIIFATKLSSKHKIELTQESIMANININNVILELISSVKIPVGIN